MTTRQHLELSDAERSSLTSLISSRHLPAKVFRRATALLELSRGKSLTEVARTLAVTYQTVAAWRDSYHERGLAALHDQARSGRPIRIDGTQRAQITALACSTPPEDRARWSLRLLADRAVELGYCERLSHHAVREVLKKTTSSRT
ncbi:MAG TPA: helix-turn-helix domain-containing protein [Pyrinomonadaceae bacterium]|nr:helix-turn-helix domain-containing protein [Pyrinomonadaceae bacterium]